MAPELPRCAVCRATIQPGMKVIFRPDGRVHHADCPPVICPACLHAIAPGAPIRREGDNMLHSNCWLRRSRARAAAHATGGTDLVVMIRAKLDAGALPRLPPANVVSSPWTGRMCAGCGGPIRGGSEYQVRFANAVSVSLHRACYEVWSEERMKAPPRTAGGSPTSA